MGVVRGVVNIVSCCMMNSLSDPDDHVCSSRSKRFIEMSAVANIRALYVSLCVGVLVVVV